MTQKLKVRPRDLSAITTDLGVALRSEIADIVKIGGLLVEARAQVGHGGWLPWLRENVSLSERSARNYMNAHDYVKLATVADSDVNVSPTVLYALANGEYPKQVAAAILKEAKSKRVGQARAHQIKLQQIIANTPPRQSAIEFAEAAEAARKQAEAEAEAILAGPPPELPAAEPAQLVNFSVKSFDDAMQHLLPLTTKPLCEFADTKHSADDLRRIAEFVNAVVAAKDLHRMPVPADFRLLAIDDGSRR